MTMAQQEQSFANHTRWDPAFHAFLTLGALALLAAAIYGMVRQPDWMGAVRIFGVIWLIVLMFKTRLYAMKVQDRVIRLEERLRLMQVLPEPMRLRAGELTESQLIALRFASDGELAQLAMQALEGRWNQKQIKQAIKTWRPDFFRV
jgi:hypothetical protein